jgi:glycosyltransferase involved in cell wall biosynthesis
MGRVNESVCLYPEKKYPAPLFINQLDCFYYRTNNNFFEPSGRVILEAMACGVVVVAHYRGGYGEYIDHGKDGFLFKNQNEAYKIIQDLRKDREMRLSIGMQARQKVKNIFSEENLKKIKNFYLS